jgi:hypothetical protein
MQEGDRSLMPTSLGVCGNKWEDVGKELLLGIWVLPWRNWEMFTCPLRGLCSSLWATWQVTWEWSEEEARITRVVTMV